MIAYFPEPYPEELWYSLCARFSDHMQFGTETGAMLALYGTRYGVASADLPHRIGCVTSQLPPAHSCTADAIIDHQTLLPYFSPFLKTTAYQEVRSSMIDGKSSFVRVKVGACTSRVRPPKFFRSCPLCDINDKNRYGEAYWHRLFQLAGVEVCPIHEIFLEPSDTRLAPLPSRHKYFSAQRAHLGSVVHRVNPNESSHGILLTLARRIDGLLRETRLNPGLEFVHGQYQIELARRGFITTAGSIRMDDLHRAVMDFYGTKFLGLLQSALPEDSGDGWLGQLLRKPRTAASPLRHHLLMAALGINQEQFFHPQLFSNLAPTTQASGGPWPCLNPACPQFRKLIICDRSIELLRKTKRSVAVLRCKKCGCVYAVYDWERPVQKADFVRDYGHVWRNRLSDLWTNKEVSVREIARQLGVDPKTVKEQAFNAGLPFPRYGKRRATESDLYQHRPAEKKSLERQRNAWTEMRRKHPQACTNQLRRYEPALYAWLYRCDQTWLKQNQPSKKIPNIVRSRVDWVSRDEKLVGQIATAAAHIKNCPGPPQRVTTTAIGRLLGKQSLFESSFAKLPLTRSMVEHVIESGEDFAVRRVHGAAARLRRTQGPFARWQLVRAAGLSHCREGHPRVKAALDYEIRPTANVIILRDGEPIPQGVLRSSTKVIRRIRPLGIVQLGA